MNILDRINSPKDIKELKTNELETLAKEIREAILFRDSKVGGHVGPNLGFVEATIALHYVFNSPKDKIVYDVSHQSYPHKIITGRKDGFLKEEQMKVISGYTNPHESEHDFFSIGHTSTSISLASGLAKARDLNKETNNIIAVIGDGSLSGGEAFEGLNNVATMKSNFIVIVNDNEMSIAENHGGLYSNLKLLRETKGQAECNLFKALGFKYHYVENGNSISEMISILSKVKDTKEPTLIHIHTNKGNGYKFASESKELWHWSVPFNIEKGEKSIDFSKFETYPEITFQHINKKLESNKKITLINAGTPGLFALSKERRVALGENYVDVGIAEQHAVAMSSGMAKGGCKPIFMVHSSFLQRTYDQLSQDLALNSNPAIILVFNSGISGADMTHLGTFDIPLVSNIPNIVYLSPTSKEEYLSMLDWAIEQKEHPIVIRVPSTIVSNEKILENSYASLNKFKMTHHGKNVAIIGLGNFYFLGEKVRKELKKHKIDATLINPRFVTGIDEEMLKELEKEHQLVITLEDGELDGGFGEKISRFYGCSKMKVLNFGSKKEFTDRIPLEKLYEKYHLTPEAIINDILKNI